MPIGTMRQDDETGLWSESPPAVAVSTEARRGRARKRRGEHAPIVLFAARCDSSEHVAGESGVSSDGRWFGSVFDTEAAAQRQADEHNQTGHAAVVGEVEER